MKFRHIILVFLTLSLSLNETTGQKAIQIHKMTMTVSNLEKSLVFYTNVLPFKKLRTYNLEGNAIQRLFGLRDKQLKVNVALLQLGEEYLELIEFESSKFPVRSIPSDAKSNDLWFQHIAIVVKDMDAAYAQLLDHQVEHVSTAPQTLPAYIPAASGISAFYFRDPDGHNLELIYFPKGKGNPRWQSNNQSLFLGIDHTAIGIERTDESLAFYSDLLGLQLAGNSENYGTEQEHLNQVFGARLLISGLIAQKGPGLEFLDYISPPGGRSYPKDSEATDLWHWHTSIKVKDVKRLYAQLQEENYKMMSSGVIQIDKRMVSDTINTVSENTSGFIVRGPDGHAILIYQ